jgi:CheY-like chemotaxis protein
MILTPRAAIYERHAIQILLAEDDVEVAKFVIAGFEEHCNSVDHVTDGRDALSYCMEGLSALKAMRAAGKNTPVLMLTALGAVDVKVEGFQAGADDYLAKPFHFSELLARVLALSRRRTERAEQGQPYRAWPDAGPAVAHSHASAPALRASGQGIRAAGHPDAQRRPDRDPYDAAEAKCGISISATTQAWSKPTSAACAARWTSPLIRL